MDSLLLILLTLTFIFPSGYLVYKISGGLNLNYVSLWFIVYVAFSLIGSLLIASGLANQSYFVIPFINKSKIIFYGGLITIYVGFIVFFPLCFLLKKVNIKSENLNFTNCNIIIRSNDKLALLLLCLFFFFSFFYYIYATNPNPLIMAIRGDSSLSIAIRRLEITKDLSLYANTYIISIGKLLVYLLSYSFIVISTNSNNYRKLTVLIIVTSILFLLSSGEKAPVLWYFIGLVYSYKIAKGQTFKLSIKLFLFLISLVLSIYLLLVSDDLNKVFLLIEDRIIIAQQIAIYASLDHYHQLFGTIGFNSFSNIFTKLFNIQSTVPASAELMASYYPGMLENGGWNINGMFAYEAWSNFGLLGVVIGPLWVMILSFMFLYLVLKAPKTPFNIAIYVYGTITITYFLTSFNSYFYNSEWIVFSLIYLIYFITSKLLNIKTKMGK